MMLIKRQPVSKIQQPDYTLKRFLDYLTASLFLISLSPIFVVVAIAIKLDFSGGISTSNTE